MSKLKLTVDFTIGDAGEEDSFELGGTIKEAAASEIISNWLRSQMGEGPDGSVPNRLKTYHIEIDWDPSDDRLFCRSDCGNKGLRDGLLLYVMRKLTGKK
jgi:hypothetical protein